MKTRICSALGCCLLVITVSAAAQSRKAGLWNISTTTRFQQPGLRGAVQGQTDQSQPAKSEDAGSPICLTQDQINTFGVLLPPSLRSCQLSNSVNKPLSLTSDLVCTGTWSGRGSIETIWTDDDHANATIHFTNKRKGGTNTVMIGWTEQATAVFKSADCGSVKPRATPVVPANPPGPQPALPARNQ